LGENGLIIWSDLYGAVLAIPGVYNVYSSPLFVLSPLLSSHLCIGLACLLISHLTFFFHNNSIIKKIAHSQQEKRQTKKKIETAIGFPSHIIIHITFYPPNTNTASASWVIQ
jgi:hypothetical protein